MIPPTARHPGRPRPVAPTPRRGRRAPAAIGALVLFAAAAVLGLGVTRPAGAAAAPAVSRAALTPTVSRAALTPANAVVVAPHDFAGADSLIATLSADGARPAVVYLPRTALARVSPAAAARLRALGFTVLRAHAAPPSGQAAETAAALAALNSLADGAAAAASGDRTVVPAGLPSLGADLKLPAAEGAAGQTQPPGLAAPAILGHLGVLPNATEPAAFAAGSVAVSIIFPQSTGANGTPHTEDWSTTDSYGPVGDVDPSYPSLTPREAYIVTEVSKTLAWWEARAPAAAQLTFVIPAVGMLGAPQQRAVAQEPITIASTDDQRWRHPIMRSLGFPKNTTDDTPPPETAYDNAVRRASGADWAFTLYVVDSLHDDAAATHDPTPGEFPDGAFAYTFDLFGPYAVETYDNDSYGPGNFDGVLAHEIGHVFGALDEYAPPAPGYPSTGDLYSGYLWVRNRNAVTGGTTNLMCIMRGGSAGLKAYLGLLNAKSKPYGGICPSTRGQIGWRDSNKNGIPDVVDTTPTVKLGRATTAPSARTVTVTGVASENPWPPGHNAQGHAFTTGISIFVPHDVQYSVDGGAWNAVGTPGTTASESFDFTTVPLGPGPDPLATTRHVIRVSATTGATATSSVVAWVGQTPVTLTLSSAAATIPLGGKARLTVRAADASAPVYPIGFLPGVRVGPLHGALKTVTTGAGGRAVAAFAPRFTTRFQATLQAGAQSQFTLVPPAPVVSVAVRALLTAVAGAPSAAGAVRVTGAFKPARSGVPLVLQLLAGGVWKTVAHTHTTARSRFRLLYTARPGAVRLRVRFAGDGRNAAAVKALPALVVP